jgi:hypothetical protein
MLAYAVRAARIRDTPKWTASKVASRPAIPAGSRHRTFDPAGALFAMVQVTLLDKKVINP